MTSKIDIIILATKVKNKIYKLKKYKKAITNPIHDY